MSCITKEKYRDWYIFFFVWDWLVSFSFIMGFRISIIVTWYKLEFSVKYLIRNVLKKFHLINNSIFDQWSFKIYLNLFITKNKKNLIKILQRQHSKTFLRKTFRLSTLFQKDKKSIAQYNTIHPHSTNYCKNMSEIFPIFHCNWNIVSTFCQILQNISSQHYNFNFLKYFWKLINTEYF